MPKLWDTKQRQGHPLHQICAYQGSFPPQLPAFFLDQYQVQNVLDPFCGRGTVLLEAVLRGRKVRGFDLLPVALALSKAKTSCPPRLEVLDEIAALDLSTPAPERPAMFEDLYHPQTWKELWNLREAKRSDALTALTLGRLHGHSPGFFSTFTFNVISLRPERLKAQREKHLARGNPAAEITYRDVKKLLLKAAKKFIPEEGLSGKASVEAGDARHMPLDPNVVDLVITSPPFLDTINYADVNWIRNWLLGVETLPDSQPSVTGMRSKEEYLTFLREVMTELQRVLRPGGTVVFEVGPVKKEANMAECVLTASKDLLEHKETLVNEFEGGAGDTVPKISRAMRGGKGNGKQTTTMSNHCVVLTKG